MPFAGVTAPPIPPTEERQLTTEFARHDLAQNSGTAGEPDRVRVIREGVASYLPDIDPDETSEWLESFDAMLEQSGPARARYLMLRLLERSGEQRVAIPALTSTDYVNTIPTELEPWFPGDEDVERRYRAWIRWNAAIMVHRAQRPGVGVGGHISTYASSAALYEVGFNHFFRGKAHPGGGDQIFIQGHASPGIYARAFLEGRLTADQLDGFRQEHSHPGGGLPVVSAPAPDARLLGVPHGVDGARPDERDLPGPLQPLPATTAASRTRPTSTCGRSSATARPTNPRAVAWPTSQRWRAWTT